MVIAYEPIWAIGTARPHRRGRQSNHCTVDPRSDCQADEATAQTVRIQYGGSVKPANIAEFMNQPEIDGALVGGASIVAEQFIPIVKQAAESKRAS